MESSQTFKGYADPWFYQATLAYSSKKLAKLNFLAMHFSKGKNPLESDLKTDKLSFFFPSPHFLTRDKTR